MFFIAAIVCVCMLCLMHTYLFFPLLLRALSLNKKNNLNVYSHNELPHVTIVMAAYNEEKVIAQKLQSILDGNYPKEKLQLIVGSDNSTDKTDDIVKSYASTFSFIQLMRFNSRTGKIGIVNKIIEQVTDEFVIITDANVLFDTHTIYELVKHFKNREVGLVDSNMINVGLRKAGISHQEKTYIQTEVGTKEAESKIWGCMMGPFGGCYALRRKLFTPVPSNFLVDDFYINMKVLEQNYKCINETNALVFEDVSNNLNEEYRRKVRIATGNFQNLFAFKHLLLKGKGVGFCFLSHKVLRWLGPVFLIVLFCCLGVLTFLNTQNNLTTGLYTILFAGMVASLLLIIADRLLNALGIHFLLLRFNTHFFYMNAAMLAGMLRYFGGVQSSIWEPTQRNQ